MNLFNEIKCDSCGRVVQLHVFLSSSIHGLRKVKWEYNISERKGDFKQIDDRYSLGGIMEANIDVMCDLCVRKNKIKRIMNEIT